MSQIPLTLDQQVPKDIWGRLAKGFWIRSSSNTDCMGLKVSTFGLKLKNDEKSQRKNEKCPHLSICREKVWEGPLLATCMVIQDG